MSEAPITAAQVAVALVAACAETGIDPAQAFDEGHGRARVMAAAGCIARLGWDRKAAARVFKVHPNRLTPSGLTLARIETEHLLVIAEALGGRGPVTPASPQPAAEAATPRRKAGTERAKAAKAAVPEALPTDPPPPSSPQARLPEARPRAAPARPTSRQTPTRTETVRPGAVERMKPVTAKVIRWSRQQLGLGADLDFVAWCFGVDADALAEAVTPRRVAA